MAAFWVGWSSEVVMSSICKVIQNKSVFCKLSLSGGGYPMGVFNSRYLVFGLICQSSLVWCRSVQNDENPGQKLAKLLIPLLDDALDPSGDDASLLEVHPHKDGKRKVELTPLNSKTKKEPKPLAIILTSNLADLKKKKEGKIRKGLVDDGSSGETNEASREQRIKTKKIQAPQRQPKIYINEIRHKPRHISQKNIKVPHYKLKRNKESHKNIILDKKDEDVTEEAEKRIKYHLNKFRNNYLRHTPNRVQHSDTTEEVTFEDESDSHFVSDSTRETSEFDNASTSESSKITESITIEDDETNEIPIQKKLKRSKVLPQKSNEVDDSSNHIHKESEAEVTDEVTSEQETKEKEDKKHKTAEQSSSEILHENLAQSLAGDSDKETKQVTSEENENTKEKHNSKSNENLKEKRHRDKHISNEKTEERHSGQVDTKETVSSEINEVTKETSKVTKKTSKVTKETSEVTKETSEVKSKEQSETSENHSNTGENDLVTAEITDEVAFEVYDVDVSKVTSEISQEEQNVPGHISHEHDNKGQNESEDKTNQISTSESNEASLKLGLDVNDHHNHKNRHEIKEASGESSESQITVTKEKSTSEEGTHEIHAHSHKHHHDKTTGFGVHSSEESTKHHSHAEIKEPNTNKFIEETPNSDVTKSTEEVTEKHWVRHRGKPNKRRSRAINKKLRRIVDSIAEYSKNYLDTGSWGVEEPLWVEHKPLGRWNIEDSALVKHDKHLDTVTWKVVDSSSAEHGKKHLGTGSWGVESASVERKKEHLGTRRSLNSGWGIDDTSFSSSEHKVPHHANPDKSNEKSDKENDKSISDHKGSHVSNAKHISEKIDAQVNHNTISEHRHHSDPVSLNHKTFRHANSEHLSHASLERRRKNSHKRKSDQTSSEHDISFRPKCQKKHVDEDIPPAAKQQNNEDKEVHNTEKDSHQNAKVHKSYNLSFKFDKK